VTGSIGIRSRHSASSRNQLSRTETGTFVLANEGSNRSYKAIGVTEGHHTLSHHGNDPHKHDKLRRINRFHVGQLAYLVGKLQAIKEGDRTLLDNCLLVYGSGNSDGNRYNHDNLPTLLVGKGGGTLRAGRHLRFPKETPLCNLWLALLQHLDVSATSFGDSTGILEVSAFTLKPGEKVPPETPHSKSQPTPHPGSAGSPTGADKARPVRHDSGAAKLPRRPGR
jgi:hypothetical protein